MRQFIQNKLILAFLVSVFSVASALAFPGGEPGWGGGGGGSGDPPPPVIGVSVPAANGTGSYSVSWARGTAFKKELQRSTNGGAYGSTVVISEGISSWAETGRADGSYQYRVRTCMDPETGSSLCSSYVYSGVAVVVLIPGTPTSLTVPSSDTNGSFSLSWGTSSGVVDNYELEESKNSAAYVNVSTGIAPSKSLSGRTDGSFTYRVRACNVSGCGGYRYGNQTLTVRITPSVPGTPVAPDNSSGNNSVSISWTKPAGTVTSYDVQKRLGSGSWTTAASGVTGTSRTLTSLGDGTWTFRVRACNLVWSCSSYGASDSTIVRLKPGTPGSINPTTTTDTNSVLVAWNTVTRATYYNIQKRNNTGAWVTAASSVSGVTKSLSGFTDGSWDFRIQGCNGYSWACSSYGIDGSSVTYRLKPSIPAAPTGPSTSTGSAAVSWVKPSGTVTYYDVQKRNNAGSWVTAKSGDTNTSETLSGLTDGSWDYRVHACNGYSWACSNYSADSSNTTVRLKPSTPGAASPTASTDTNDVTVSWTAVSTATYYNIQKRNNSGSWISVSGSFTGTSVVVNTSEFSDGSWDFRIRACNAYSWACSSYGTDGSQVAWRQIPNVPGAPNPTTTQDTNAVTVSWTAVSGTTYYNIQKRNNAGAWANVSGNFTSTSGSVGSLADGSWDFRIRACNDSWACTGYGVDGTSVTTRAKPSVPAAPTAPSTDGNGSYTVSWVQPSGTVTFYDLLERQDNAGSWTTVANDTTAVSKALSGRGDGAYDYKVRACNGSWACSAYSTLSNDVVVLLVPGVPPSITNNSQDTDSSVTIDWGTSSGQVDDYRLEEQIDGGAWVQQSSGSLSLTETLTGQTDGDYLYRVRACNATGCSGFRTGTTLLEVRIKPTTPNAPTGPATSTGVAAIIWTSVTNATYYDIQKRNNSGTWNTAKLGDTNTSESIAGLGDGSWDFRVKACNQESWSCSNYSVDSANTTVRVIPPVPTVINTPTVANINDVTVSWSSVSGATYYNIEKRADGGSWTSASGDFTTTSNELLNLTDGSWDFRIRACNGSWACSNYSVDSANVSVVNIPGMPGAISSPTSSEGAYTVSWGASSGQVTSYKLEEKKGTAGSYTQIYSGTGTSYNLDQTINDSYYYRVKACNGSGCSAFQTTSQAVVVVIVEDWARKSTVVNITDAPFIAPTVPTHELTLGKVEGSSGVSGGSASYQIPIALPPGRANMAPSVSVSYSSKSGNGSMGMGWGLSVGSSVSRCPRIVALDGESRNVQLDSQDRLCLDGQFLILMSGSYGLDGAEYRTELNNFARVTQSGNMSTDTSSFKVEWKNGRISHYGTSLQSTFVGSGVTVPSTWAIEMEEDRTPARNNIRYQYTAFAAGEYLLTKINYTGSYGNDGNRFVEFNYAAGTRSDPSNRYLAGGLTRQTKLLENIKTYAIDPNTPIFEYRFSYQLSQASSRNLLQSVTQCDGLDNCLPATTFEWNDAEASFELEPLQYTNTSGSQVVIEPNASYISRSVPQGDINADGVRDWPGVYVNAEGKGETNGSDPLQTCFLDPFSFLYTCLSGDFNQDGLTDSWKVENDTLRIRNTVDGSAGTWFDTFVPVTGQFSKLNDVNDYNGDGWPDLVIFEFTANCAKLYLHTNTKNPNQPYTAARQLLYTYACAAVRFNPEGQQQSLYGEQWLNTSIQFMGDMDGNGLPDLMVSDLIYQYLSTTLQHAQPVPKTLLLTQMSGSQVSFASHDLTSYISMDREIPNYFNFFMDINGDGMQDWLSWSGESINSNHQISLALNKGGDFEAWQNLGADSYLAFRQYLQIIGGGSQGEPQLIRTPKYSSNFRQMDYNNDGRAELLVPGQRVISGCATLYQFDTYNASGGTPSSSKTYCGDELYENIRTSSTQQFEAPINSGLYDESIYQYDAIFFEEQSGGGYLAVKRPTQLYGSASQTTTIDAFGNGLTDFIFTYNCRNTSVCSFDAAATVASPMDNIPMGLIINKSIGSSTGSTDYEAPDMLAAVEDGFSNRSEWTYRPLSSDKYSEPAGQDFYGMDKNALAPGYFHFASSMYVVAEFRQSNGVGGLNTQQYKYEAAVFNNEGRGFQGFREITVDNLASGLRSYSKFDQFFPKAGSLELTRTCLITDAADCTPSTFISEKQFQYTTQQELSAESTNPLYWTYSSQSDTRNHDLTSRLYLSGSTNTVEFVDDYGNTLQQRQVIDAGDSTSEILTTNTFYPVNLTDWWINKNDTTTVLKKALTNRTGLSVSAELDFDKTVTTSFGWNDLMRKPNLLTTTPTDNPVLAVTLATSNYTDYGQPKIVTQTAQVTINGIAQQQDRTATTNYDATDSYFVKDVTNGLNQKQTFNIRTQDGQPNWIEDVNLLRTTTYYDSFNRPIEVQVPGTPSLYTSLQSCDATAPAGCQYLRGIYKAGTATNLQFMDSFNRPIQSRVQAMEGNILALEGAWIYTGVTFDSLGRKDFESAPQFDSISALGTHYVDYDALGRLTRKTVDTADNYVLDVTYIYEGLTTKVRPVGMPEMSRTYNGLNQLTETVDAAGAITQYAYDGAGNPVILQDANNSQILAKYSAIGSKYYVIDPNMGRKDFVYNGFGEVSSETDANNDTLSYDYDILGRIQTRYLNGVSEASWQYDALGHLGLVSSESLSDGGFSRSFGYDAVQRPTIVDTTIGSESFTTTTFYDDDFGRPKGFSYPNGFTLKYTYDDFGYQTEVSNAESGYVYQTQETMDERGNLKKAILAGGLITKETSYDPADGQMKFVLATTNTGESPYYIGYQYEDFGNLNQQTVQYSNNGNLYTATENYNYDDMHRLTQSNVVNSSGTYAIDYIYDLVGNLFTKSDYSSNYVYGDTARTLNNAGPNAVSKVLRNNDGLWKTFSYDNNGNQTSNGQGTSITYNAQNKPTQIDNGVQLSFSYGADIKRYRQIRQNDLEQDTTLYLAGGKYERITRKSSGIWSRTTERVTLGDIAVINWTDDISTGQNHRLNYLLRDRLGSVMTVITEQGLADEFRSYDPFGKPREGDLSTLAISRLSSLTSGLELATNRGFTDHEHLDDAELIHMNGRVYDYNLGRFLSVDPVIQSPGNSQSVNPYSYIMNNPLAGTDPTGYESEFEKKHTIKVSKTGSHIKRKVQVSVSKSGNTTTVALSGGGAGARQGVADSITSAGKAAGFNSVDIGSTEKRSNTQQDTERNSPNEGNPELVDSFIKNNVIHTTETFTEDYSDNPKTSVPNEVREALIEMTKNSIGLSLLNYYIETGYKLELIDTTATRTVESGTIGFGFVGDYRDGGRFKDAIYYNLDLKGFRAQASKSSPFINKDVIESFSLDVLLVAEFGHTSASSIFGLDARSSYDEIISHGTVENSYRAAVGKPIRNSYFQKNDILDYMNSK